MGRNGHRKSTPARADGIWQKRDLPPSGAKETTDVAGWHQDDGVRPSGGVNADDDGVLEGSYQREIVSSKPPPAGFQLVRCHVTKNGSPTSGERFLFRPDGKSHPTPDVNFSNPHLIKEPINVINYPTNVCQQALMVPATTASLMAHASVTGSHPSDVSESDKSISVTLQRQRAGYLAKLQFYGATITSAGNAAGAAYDGDERQGRSS